MEDERLAETEEPEITPEMIEAGVDAISRIRWDMDTFDEMARDIYSAMEAAKQKAAISTDSAPMTIHDKIGRL